MSEEPGEVYHVGRDGNKETNQQGLVLVNVPDAVNAVHKGNQKESEEGRKQPCYEIRIPKRREHSCSDEIQEGSVVTRVIYPRAFCQ